MTHRKAPLPPGYDASRPRGQCRLCGGALADKRQVYHPECRALVAFTRSPTFARLVIEARDKGKCAVCGSTDAPWHVEHRVPLWKVRHLPDAERFYYFTPANVDTVCVNCHPFKSAKETTERAHIDRLEKEKLGLPKRRRRKVKIPQKSAETRRREYQRAKAIKDQRKKDART